MTDTQPLLVPIELHAMVLNGRARNFRRWQMNYNKLQSYESPEPAPFSGGGEDNFSQLDENEGVYLMWTLPQALRHGYQKEDSPDIEFPLVPNRWLVVRYSGPLESRRATAWVVESDYLDSEDGSIYLDPTASSPRQIRIGRSVPLNNPQWKETNTKDLFLRAVAPGNLMFAAYQPTCQNVFSFHDDLTNQGITQDTLSYLVVGWYSDVTHDPLNRWQAGVEGNDYQDVLDELKWVVQDGDQTPRCSIYHGMISEVKWKKGTEHIPSPRDVAEVKVAVGNTDVDALTALIMHQAEESDDPNKPDALLFEAFQYGLLHVLDEPGGQDLLSQKIRDAWYGSQSGGTVWEIVDRPPAGNEPAPPPPSPEELAKENQWLAELNADQARLDQMHSRLSTLQRDLYEMWWKRGYATARFNTIYEWPYRCSREQFDAVFDTDDPNSLIRQVNQLLDDIAAIQARIPTTTADKTLDEAIDEFARAKGLPETRRLKATAKSRFWHANDPVILIAGANHGQVMNTNDALACRTMDQVVSGFVYNDDGDTITGVQVQAIIPALDITNLPPAVGAFLQEFFLLDPLNGASIARRVLQRNDPNTIQGLASRMGQHAQPLDSQRLPALDLEPWSQPWLPLLIEWEVEWYHIPYAQDGQLNWEFQGMDFEWTRPIAQPQGVPLQGRSLLTPKTSFSFKSCLERFINDHPDEEGLKSLDEFIEQVDQWDFLSQVLTGFGEQLARRDPLATLAPDDTASFFPSGRTMADLISDQHHAIPQSIMIKKQRHVDLEPSTFEAMRNGQFLFTRITIVDRFGQTIEVLTSQNSDTFYPIISDALKPTQYVLPTETARLVQLPPRLLQNSRRNFEYVSSHDDAETISPHSDVNPICGWILPNHLDESLSIYAPDGLALGEVYVTVDASQKRTVHWEAAPNGRFQSLDAVGDTYPHLGQFLTALQSQGAEAYANLLTVIDETLWTVDPLGSRADQSLSVLIGRLLVIARARLQLELQEEPLLDPRWPNTFDPQVPFFTDYDFFVRLGNQHNYQDGLIGYFVGEDYSVFHAVHHPDGDNVTSYIKRIEPGNYIPLQFNPHSEAFVTMLIDPRATVHAQTGLLPTKRLNLPSRFVNAALNNMEVTFHVGPLLTHIQTPDDENTANETTSKPKLFTPSPAEKHGVWSWLEADQWAEMDVADTDQTARFRTKPPTLREGLLKLKGAIHDEK